MTSLFVFGTLRDPALLEIVLGRAPAPEPAFLPNHRVLQVAGEDFPICVPSPDHRAEGLFLGDLSDAEMARLDFYELGFGYCRAQHGINVAGEMRQADLYMPRQDALTPSETEWSLSRWQAEHGALTRATAALAMELAGRIEASELPGRWPVLAARAQTRMAARARPAPRRDGLPDLARLETDKVLVPYDGYFRLEEHHLRFPRFNGGVSETVNRVAFLSVDAVTVLPYDPRRDRVLLVDQFRMGAYVRGDAQPWTLEPVAGRVDGGETWEETAHREAREEAGLTLSSLEMIAGYYPSPGALTEYLVSYLGLCDLPDSQAGHYGMADEAEDIRVHLVAFDELMEMARDGRIQNGPLLVSALWLAAHRDRLRGAG